MSAAEKMRTVRGVEPIGPAGVRLLWSDGVRSDLDLSGWLSRPGFAALQDPAEFARVQLGDWGHSIVWSSGIEAGADSLWLETLSAQQQNDTRAFLEWRLRHGLSLTKAAEALGLSRRMVAYYSNGEKTVPRTILLACRGWEVADNPTKVKVGQYREYSPASLGVAERPGSSFDTTSAGDADKRRKR